MLQQWLGTWPWAAAESSTLPRLAAGSHQSQSPQPAVAAAAACSGDGSNQGHNQGHMCCTIRGRRKGALRGVGGGWASGNQQD